MQYRISLMEPVPPRSGDSLQAIQIYIMALASPLYRTKSAKNFLRPFPCHPGRLNRIQSSLPLPWNYT